MAMSLPTPRSSTREWKKNLVCDICRHVFRSPRALPNCHHCFCLQCLNILVTSKGATFPCPTCGETANVPAGGVQHFKENPYILEEELEEERNAVTKSYCSFHHTEELIFFCKECDLPICLCCKMASHDHGPQSAEDLSTTAERCKTHLAPLKKQLRRDIKNATERSAVAQNNIRAVTKKATEFRKQLKERKDRIVSWAEKHHETAVRQLDQMTQVMTQELTKDGHDVQHYLDRLIQIEQRIHNAMDTNNHADVVAVEKETRRHGEAIKQLIQMQNNLSVATQFPDLNCNDNYLTEKSITEFIGSPFKKQLPLEPVQFEDDTGDVITQFYRCPATAEGQEVHAISQQVQLGQQNVYISYGGLAPTYKEETLIEIENNSTKRKHYDKRIGKKITFDENGSVRSNHEDDLSGNSKRSVRISYKTKDGKVTIHETAIIRANGVRKTKEVLHEVAKAMTPINFDANNFTSIFIVLSENASPPAQEHDRFSRNNPHAAGNGSQASRTSSANMRKIQMYLLNQSDPVCSYVPPQQPFFPTAVCFCIINEQEVLLIADMATDSIHVVDVANKNFRFIRYLAQWSPHLVRPTALYGKQQEHEVWIGCQNGWVLKCKPGTNVRQQQRDDDGDEDGAADGGSDALTDNLNIDNASVTSTSATSAELLRVGNGSMMSLATTNRMSDVSEYMI